MYRYTINSAFVLLLALLPGLYLADILYGLFNYLGLRSNISPGTIIRGGVFFISLFIIAQNYRKLRGAWLFVLILLFYLAIPGALMSINSDPSLSTIYREFQTITRVLFGPTVVLLFVILIKKWNIPADMVMKNIEYCFYLLGVSLLFMQWLNIGEYTYGEYASGSKGIFGPQNDISLSLGLALVVTAYRNIVYFSITRMGLMSLAIFGFVGIGTRTSLILAIIIPALMIVMLLLSRSDYWRVQHRLRLLVIISPLILIFISYAGYYTYQQLSQYQYQIAKYEELTSGRHPRDFLLEGGYRYLGAREPYSMLFGEGVTKYRRGVYRLLDVSNEDQMKMTEVDWLDLYGAYGLLFTVLLHGVALYFLVLAMSRWMRTRHPYDGVGSIVLGIYLGHSALAGHALTSPISSGLVAAICSLLLVTRFGAESDRVVLLNTS